MPDGTPGTPGRNPQSVPSSRSFPWDDRRRDRRRQRDCPHMHAEFYVIVCSNGARQLRLMCTECHLDDGKNIPHWRAGSRGIDAIPVIADLRTLDQPCERCGESATEFHHWAPKHLFADYDQWPTAYLCVACHLRWHQIIIEHHRAA